MFKLQKELTELIKSYEKDINDIIMIKHNTISKSLTSAYSEFISILLTISPLLSHRQFMDSEIFKMYLEVIDASTNLRDLNEPQAYLAIMIRVEEILQAYLSMAVELELYEVATNLHNLLSYFEKN